MGNAHNSIIILTSDIIIAIGEAPGTLTEVALTIKTGTQLLLITCQMK